MIKCQHFFLFTVFGEILTCYPSVPSVTFHPWWELLGFCTRLWGRGTQTPCRACSCRHGPWFPLQQTLVSPLTSRQLPEGQGLLEKERWKVGHSCSLYNNKVMFVTTSGIGEKITAGLLATKHLQQTRFFLECRVLSSPSRSSRH